MSWLAFAAVLTLIFAAVAFARFIGAVIDSFARVRRDPVAAPWELRCRVVQFGLVSMYALPFLSTVIPRGLGHWFDALLMTWIVIAFLMWLGGLFSLAAYERFMKREDVAGLPTDGPVGEAQAAARSSLNTPAQKAAAHETLAQYFMDTGDIKRARAERERAWFLTSDPRSRLRLI